MRHAFGIPAMTKSRFGKNQSYKVLAPDLRYVINASIIMHTHARACEHTHTANSIGADAIVQIL